MDWFERLPKIELHLHLEGAIPYRTLWELIQKCGGDPSVSDLASLEKRFVYRDFPQFLETWMWKNNFLREYADFTQSAEAVAQDLARQGVRYAEVFYSPTDFAQHGLEPQPITAAIREGLNRVPGIEIALVADLVRGSDPAAMALTLEKVHEVKNCGVIGIGIGGSEYDYPPEPFAAIYQQARKLGFRTSAHAGEAAGAPSIWGAIRALQVDRIGHGTRAEEDPTLLDYLLEHQLPLEMCPLSNLRTGVVKTFAEHPVRRFFERGLLVTVNTDDPKMFNNSLAVEYRMLVDELDFSREDVRTLILNGIQASWLPAGRKKQLAADFRNDPAWLES